METRFEHSAGGVVIRGAPAGRGADADVVIAALEVALASHRRRSGELAWGLPKGLIEPGEDAADTAVREVREETGLIAKIRAPLADVSYIYVWDGVRVRKKVTFFLMDAVGGDIADHDHEMEDVQWFPLAGADRRASYTSEKDMLRKAARVLAERAEPG